MIIALRSFFEDCQKLFWCINVINFLRVIQNKWNPLRLRFLNGSISVALSNLSESILTFLRKPLKKLRYRHLSSWFVDISSFFFYKIVYYSTSQIFFPVIWHLQLLFLIKLAFERYKNRPKLTTPLKKNSFKIECVKKGLRMKPSTFLFLDIVDNIDSSWNALSNEPTFIDLYYSSCRFVSIFFWQMNRGRGKNYISNNHFYMKFPFFIFYR